MNNRAYHFLAYDRVGMKLTGVTDHGVCEWEGDPVMREVAESFIATADAYGYFKDEPEDMAPLEDSDSEVF